MIPSSERIRLLMLACLQEDESITDAPLTTECLLCARGYPVRYISPGGFDVSERLLRESGAHSGLRPSLDAPRHGASLEEGR